MASISACSSQSISSFYWNPFSKSSISCPFSLSFPLGKNRFCSIKAVLDGGGGVVRNIQETTSYGTDLLRKPAVLSPGANDEEEPASEYPEEDESETKGRDGDTWVDWENQILEDTVPLVGFVRMLLHSGKYEVGDRLSLQHERIILDRLLPHHPEWEKKIGSGVDYITVGYHPDFDTSRCLFIVRRDGELVDFSYWKCIKGLIRKNYPLYAESFILRHFRRGRRPTEGKKKLVHSFASYFYLSFFFELMIEIRK